MKKSFTTSFFSSPIIMVLVFCSILLIVYGSFGIALDRDGTYHGSVYNETSKEVSIAYASNLYLSVFLIKIGVYSGLSILGFYLLLLLLRCMWLAAQ